MTQPQYVILKGRKDGISISLDEHADFELIRLALRKKVADTKRFFEGANANVSFKGRALSDAEEKSLLEIITAETTLDVGLIEEEGFRYTLPAPHASVVENKSGQYFEQPTMFYRNGLRSGQSIRYQGSVVVIGDVNPGSEIIAGGNVVVLGALKGMVHAGADGDNRCYVSALILSPTQLRIANIITYIPKSTITPNKKNSRPQYAYIQDGQVYIAPLMD